jgi:hypothetical protein
MKTKKYKSNSKQKQATQKKRSFLDQTFSKKGGTVIASGGFGCIFNPALKCKNKTHKNINLVSKLMKIKNAKKEFKEITKFKPILQKIPNYQNYFLIEGFSLCQPDTILNTDIQNFNKKCSALKKIDINENNINKHLNKLLALNMPFGGISVDNFIEKNATNIHIMKYLNKCLIELLEKGIIPMNSLGVFHCDLKSSNILVNEKNDKLYTKIIDWGLSTTYNININNINNNNNTIPDVLTRRPLQYNVPFSNILFNSTFNKLYSKFLNQLKDNSEKQTYDNTYTFTIEYVLKWITERGQGHIKTISNFYSIFFINQEIDLKVSNLHIKYEKTFHFIFKYITEILVAFTHNYDFNIMDYFNHVFIKNIDVWGLVLSYIPFLEYSYDYPNNSNQKINDYFKKLITIILNASIKPIPIDLLTDTLTQFNKIIYYYKHDKSTSSSFNSSSSRSFEIIESDKHLSITERKKRKKVEHAFIIKTLKSIISSNSKS